jgi:hypothetical protein
MTSKERALDRPPEASVSVSVWEKAWFNVVTFVVYALVCFLVAGLFSPNSEVVPIFGGALTYGCGNVHFVLWFTFYTRKKKEAQDGLGAESRDELFS